MSVICIKLGQTLLLTAQCVQDDGTPVDITGVTLASQVQDANASLVATLTVTIVDAANGQFTLSAPTADWPLGVLNCDVRYAQNGAIIFSQTFQFLVVPSITAPPGGGS